MISWSISCTCGCEDLYTVYELRHHLKTTDQQNAALRFDCPCGRCLTRKSWSTITKHLKAANDELENQVEEDLAQDMHGGGVRQWQGVVQQQDMQPDAPLDVLEPSVDTRDVTLFTRDVTLFFEGEETSVIYERFLSMWQVCI
jgi:hypothetical protein